MEYLAAQLPRERSSDDVFLDQTLRSVCLCVDTDESGSTPTVSEVAEDVEADLPSRGDTLAGDHLTPNFRLPQKLLPVQTAPGRPLQAVEPHLQRSQSHAASARMITDYLKHLQSSSQARARLPEPQRSCTPRSSLRRLDVRSASPSRVSPLALGRPPALPSPLLQSRTMPVLPQVPRPGVLVRGRRTPQCSPGAGSRAASPASRAASPDPASPRAVRGPQPQSERRLSSALQQAPLQPASLSVASAASVRTVSSVTIVRQRRSPQSPLRELRPGPQAHLLAGLQLLDRRWSMNCVAGQSEADGLGATLGSSCGVSQAGSLGSSHFCSSFSTAASSPHTPSLTIRQFRSSPTLKLCQVPNPVLKRVLQDAPGNKQLVLDTGGSTKLPLRHVRVAAEGAAKEAHVPQWDKENEQPVVVLGKLTHT